MALRNAEPPAATGPRADAAAHRAATRRLGTAQPFPAIQCTGLAPVKRILATSDAVTGTILSCIAGELESGRFVLLGTEPWLHLHYGIVSLKGRPWTRATERLRELVLEAERDATRKEQQLLTRFGPRYDAACRARSSGKRG